MSKVCEGLRLRRHGSSASDSLALIFYRCSHDVLHEAVLVVVDRGLAAATCAVDNIVETAHVQSPGRLCRPRVLLHASSRMVILRFLVGCELLVASLQQRVVVEGADHLLWSPRRVLQLVCLHRLWTELRQCQDGALTVAEN